MVCFLVLSMSRLSSCIDYSFLLVKKEKKTFKKYKNYINFNILLEISRIKVFRKEIKAFKAHLFNKVHVLDNEALSNCALSLGAPFKTIPCKGCKSIIILSNIYIYFSEYYKKSFDNTSKNVKKKKKNCRDKFLKVVIKIFYQICFLV